MTTYAIYNQLIDVYKRVGRPTAELALRIDTAYAVGRLGDEDYAELILKVTEE